VNVAIVRFLLRILPSRIAIAISKRLGLDIRAMWSHSRMTYLARDKYEINVKKLIHLITNGCCSPVGWGLEWGCAMEASFRAIHLARFLRRNSANKKQLIAAIALFELRKNVKFVCENLETHSFNNHYLLNICAIAVADALAENVVPSAFGRSFYDVELSRCCKNQFLADGTNFEGSTSYHALALEALAIVAEMNPRSGALIRESINLNNALLFLQGSITRQGELIAIGDNDSSTFVPSERFRLLQQEYIMETFVSDGRGLATGKNRVIWFRDFQAAIYRGQRYSFYLWMPQADQNGKGGHNHDDLGSISVLCGQDRLIIGDPGIYSYTHDRRAYRERGAHSVVISPNVDLRSRDFTGNFQSIGKGTGILRGSGDRVEAHVLLNNGAKITRFFRMEENRIEALDRVEYQGTLAVRCTALFTLHPDVRLDIERGAIIFRDKKTEELIAKMHIGEEVEVFTSPIFYAPEYGMQKKSVQLALASASASLEWSLIFQAS